ncbi:hypothetical protein TA3x_002436 [Tundrisphaera sp. TA3]|uniref:hypothetical protein n=1 Tax=Tundrisphaera sp. TA3 TaxID=3435775 RepID=UPI003EB9A4C2
MRILCGAGLMVLGGWIVLCIFAFASMVDPSLDGREWWSEVLDHMDSGGGWPPMMLGIIMIGGGMLMVGTSVVGLFRDRPETP